MHGRRWTLGLMMTVVLCGCTVRASVDTEGGDANSSSSGPSISTDGRYVAFTSLASDLVDDDGNTGQDIYRRDLQERTTERISVDTAGGDANFDSFDAHISGDGDVVAFSSLASDLVAGDGNGRQDIFVRTGGVTVRASVDAGAGDANDHSFNADISRNGKFVAFTSIASDLVAGDGNGVFDVFLRDLDAGTTERVSVDSTGADSNGSSSEAAVSADGRYVAFSSYASDLVPGDGNGTSDVFVRDRVENTTTRVSVDTAGGDPNQFSTEPAITDDGQTVAFSSIASDLVANDNNVCLSELGPYSCRDVFVRDVDQGTTTRVSVDTNGRDANRDSSNPSISADGQVVAFISNATDLVPNDGNGDVDVFVRDLTAGTTARAAAIDGGDPDFPSGGPSLSGDGRALAFDSFATNLTVSDDLNNTTDVFVRTRRRP
jgi:Tol biopolymer transport system component